MKLIVLLAPAFIGLSIAQVVNITATPPIAVASTTDVVRPSPTPDAKGEDAKGGDAKGGDAKGGDAKGGDAKGGDAKGDAKGATTCAIQFERKEIRDMSSSEWGRYVTAFKAMNEDGSLARYVNWHIEAWSLYHWNEKFLPFHRAYLREFERELVNRGADFLPYWDSTVESQDPPKSALFTSKYFGRNDGTNIIDGAFSMESGYRTVVGGGPLVRDYNPEGTGAFYARSLIEDDIMVIGFSDFSKRLEIGPHSAVHSIIGGTNGQMAKSVSPEDPLFMVHHCFIDKLWDEHQTRYGYKYEGDEFDNKDASETDSVGFSTWAMQVGDLLRNRDICVSYIEPVGAIENVNETIRAPEIGVNFLNGTGANLTFVKELEEETKKSTEKINTIQSTSGVGSLVASLSVGMLAIGFALI
jgi:hypothetical protein